MGTTREPVDIEFVLKGDIEKDIHKVEQNIKSMGKEGDVSYKKLQSASFETFQALSKENQIRAVALQDTIKRMKANENEQREATAQFKSKTISADEYAKAMARLSVRSAELKSTAAGLSAQVQKEIQMNQMVEGSYDKKIAKLDALRKEYKSLTVEEMKNAEVGGKMITQIRQLEKETGKVDEALKGAGRGVMGFINRMEQAPGVIGSTVGGMKQLIVQSLKFIATPIGAIIAAIVVGLKLLTTWFHRSAEGENAMITASAYFSQILDSLLNVVAKVGEWLYKAWEKPLDALKDLVQFMKDQVINRFVGLGNIFISLKDIGVNSFKLIKASIQDIWSDQDAAIKESKEGFKNAAKDMANAYGQVLTGIENPLDKLVDFAKETTEQADKRAAIAAELHKLDLQELQTKKEVAETEVKIAELREKAKNNETDERERLKYIKEAQRLTDEIDKKQIAELAKRLDLTRQKLLLEKGVTDVNKLTLEDLRTLNDLELQILSKQEEKSNRMRALLDQQNAINGKIATEKTATELINKELELKKEAYQTYYRFIAATDKAYANERFADLVKGGESYLEYINRKIEELKGKQTRSKTEDVQLSAYQGEKMEIMGTSNPVDVLRREMEEKKKLYADDIEAYQKYLQDKKALLEGDTTDMGPSMRTVVDAELTDANTAVQKNLDELVKKYQTYTLQLTSLEKDYQRDIARLRAELSNENSKYSKEDIEEAIKAREQASSAAIAKLTAEDADFYEVLFGNLDRISKQSIDAAIAKAKAFIEKIKSEHKNGTKEMSAEMEQYLIKLQEGIAKAEEESKTRLPENLQKVAAILKDAANMAALFDEELGQVINTAAEVAAGISSIATGVAKMETDPVGGITSIISGITGIVSAFKKQSEAQKKAAEEWEMMSMKSYLSDFEYNELLRERKRIQQQIGETTLQYNSRITNELQKQKSQNERDYNVLWNTLMKGQHDLSGPARKDFGSTVASIYGKSFDEIKKLYDSDQLSEKAKLLFEQLQKLKDEGEDINKMLAEQAEAMREALTGTTSEAITDAIVAGFENGYKSAADFADTFQDMMKKAVLQALKLQVLEEPIRQWYEAFAASMQAGTIDTDMERLNKQWEAIIGKAADWMDAAEQVTGLTFGETGSQTAKAGAITTITEATGSKLEGHFVAVRVNTGKLVESVADIQARFVKQALDTAEIAKNTRELYRLEAVESTLKRLENDGIKIKS